MAEQAIIMGSYNKATGITRPVKGEKEWVELWVGDVIKCRVYITDRAGCYLWINRAEVFWEKDYGQYSIKASYRTGGGQDVDGIFALRDVLRRDVEFITKVPRIFGTARAVVLAVVDMLRSYSKEPTDIGDLPDGMEENVALDIICKREDIQAIVNTVTYDMLDTIVSEIGDFGVIPKELVNGLFNRDR